MLALDSPELTGFRFLDKTDAEKKAFLTPVLGLDKFEQQAKQSAASVSVAEKEVAALDAQIVSLERQMATLTPDNSLDEVMAAGMQLKARTEERKAKIDFLAGQVEDIQDAGNLSLIHIS